MHRSAYILSPRLVIGSNIEVIAFETPQESTYKPSKGDTLRIAMLRHNSFLCGEVVSVRGKNLYVDIDGQVAEWSYSKSVPLITTKGSVNHYYCSSLIQESSLS